MLQHVNLIRQIILPQNQINLIIQLKATQPKTTAKQTTTKKSYDPDPAYGTVKFSYPDGNYKVDHWSAARAYWIWDGEQWNANINISGGMHTPHVTKMIL